MGHVHSLVSPNKPQHLPHPILICISLAAVKNAAQLTGVRFVVGAGEALGQCGVFYLSLWYNRKELATRTAIVFSTSALASSFGGLVAYGIQKNLPHAHGILAWQWLFIIEGIFSKLTVRAQTDRSRYRVCSVFLCRSSCSSTLA